MADSQAETATIITRYGESCDPRPGVQVHAQGVQPVHSTAETDEALPAKPSATDRYTWRYWQQAELPFDPLIFDSAQLADHGLLSGTAVAGRGHTHFFDWHGQALVLRHYRRGGLVQHLNRQHYCYCGIERTRAMREFAILVFLVQRQIPVSRPFACQVERQGPFYRASLVTHRLPGRTLAECLSAPSSMLDESVWPRLGCLIAGLHATGVWHADLNCHNLMIDDQEGSHGGLALIDFDRARQRRLPLHRTNKGWCRANIERLRRSVVKVSARPSRALVEFSRLEAAWQKTLSSQGVNTMGGCGV